MGSGYWRKIIQIALAVSWGGIGLYLLNSQYLLLVLPIWLFLGSLYLAIWGLGKVPWAKNWILRIFLGCLISLVAVLTVWFPFASTNRQYNEGEAYRALDVFIIDVLEQGEYPAGYCYRQEPDERYIEEMTMG